MINRIIDRCERYIQKRDLAQDALFKWTGGYTLPVCALILSASDIRVDGEYLAQCRKKIKAKTGVFSNFRGTVMEPMACMLAVAQKPEELLENAVAAHEELRRYFASSEYLPLVALIIARFADREQYPEIAQKTRSIYDRMKKDHPFLTSVEDGPFAALMLFSGKDEAEICAEAESCYELLRGEFSSGNSLQSLSHVLTLGEGTAQEKCSKLTALYDALKLRGCKYGKGIELSTLGALSVLSVDVNTIADSIVEAADYLRGQKGYGFFGAGRTERLMHAAMIVGNMYIENDESGAPGDITLNCSITATIAMIAAQQAAMCAAIAAAAAANSASS